jgi:hypothetical protein
MTRTSSSITLALSIGCASFFACGHALAHGFAGQRFFPATILTDDPFVADEMSLPTVTFNPTAGDNSKETDFGFDLAKRLTPNLGLTCTSNGSGSAPRINRRPRASALWTWVCNISFSSMARTRPWRWPGSA